MQSKKSSNISQMSGFIDIFLRYMIENKGKSPQTTRNYRLWLERYQKYLFQVKRGPDEVSMMDIEAYTGPVLSKMGTGVSGRCTAITAIRQFYRFCYRRGLLKSNPARDLEHPKREKSLPGILSLNEIEKLMFAPDLSTFAGLRDAAIMAFMFSTGCRVSGLTSLNEDHLAYGGEEKPLRLYVTLKEKGKKSRKLPMNRKCELLLSSYLNHPEMSAMDRCVGKTKVVFVNVKNTVRPNLPWIGERRRITPKSIGSILKKYGKRLGIPEKVLHVHAGRHAVGTALYEAGETMEDRMYWMGHESPETMVIYPRLSESKLLKASNEANVLSRIKTPIDALMKSVFASKSVI